MEQTILREGPILIFDKSTEQGVGGCLGSLQDLHPRGGPAHTSSGIGVGERFPLPGSLGCAGEGAGWRQKES